MHETHIFHHNMPFTLQPGVLTWMKNYYIHNYWQVLIYKIRSSLTNICSYRSSSSPHGTHSLGCLHTPPTASCPAARRRISQISIPSLSTVPISPLWVVTVTTPVITISVISVSPPLTLLVISVSQWPVVRVPISHLARVTTAFSPVCIFHLSVEVFGVLVTVLYSTEEIAAVIVQPLGGKVYTITLVQIIPCLDRGPG